MQERSPNGALIATVVIPLGILLGAWGDCEPSPRGDASATEAAFVPSGVAIHRSEARRFEVDGREVQITHVEYGELMDCPSGCFASHVCAIEDGEDVLLFHAYWNDEEERPRGIDAECPPATTAFGDTWPDCEPRGRCHALNREPSFQRWAEDQAGQGPFRFCVNQFAYEDYVVAACATP